jgi:hypothetical protein
MNKFSEDKTRQASSFVFSDPADVSTGANLKPKI